jgi:hypothetical protein
MHLGGHAIPGRLDKDLHDSGTVQIGKRLVTRGRKAVLRAAQVRRERRRCRPQAVWLEGLAVATMIASD